QQLYSFPRHPYTGALLSAVPVPEPAGGKRQRQLLTGDVPSPANPPPACRFHTRCPKMQEICRTEEPLLEDKGRSTQAACHFPLTQDEVKSQLPKALATSTDGTSPAAPIGIPSAPIRATRPARRATPGEEVRRDLPLDDLLRRRAWAGWIDVLLLVILAVVIAFTVGNSHIGSWTTVNSGVVTKHSGVSF